MRARWTLLWLGLLACAPVQTPAPKPSFGDTPGLVAAAALSSENLLDWCPAWMAVSADAPVLEQVTARFPTLAVDPPSHPQALLTALYLACAAFPGPEFDNVLGHFERASALADSRAAQDALGETLLGLDRWVPRVDELARRLIEDPARSAFWQARLRFEHRPTHPSVRILLEEALVADPDHLPSKFWLARVRHEAGAPGVGAWMLDELPEHFARLEVRYWRGRAYLDDGRPDRARADLEWFLEQTADWPGPPRDRASLWQDELQFPMRSIKGLRLDDVHCPLMRIARDAGDLDRALRHGAYVNSFECKRDLADIYRTRGDAFHALLAGGSSDPVIEAELYLELGLVEKAISVLERGACGARYASPERCEAAEARLRALREAHPPHAGPSPEVFPGLLERLAKEEQGVFRRTSRTAKVALDVSPMGPEGHNVVYTTAHGKRSVACSVSHTLDRTGEVTRGGYWLHMTDDQGHWGPPIYTGLREHGPYVIRGAPRQPFDGRRLVLPVDIQELDPTSITFPPVALRYSRQEEGLALQVDLTDLTRDTDGDGWTDLFEARVATDPKKADTDGDGLDDPEDALPLSPSAAAPTLRDEVLFAFLAHLLGHPPTLIQNTPDGEQAIRDKRADVMFVVGDEPLTALELLGRTVVLMPAEAWALYRRRFGPAYPMSYGTIVVSPSGEEAFMRYNFSFGGGLVYGRRVDGRWEVEVRSQWISSLGPLREAPSSGVEIPRAVSGR